MPTTQIINGVEIIRGLDINEYHRSPILSHTKIQYWLDPDVSPRKWKARFVDGAKTEKEQDHFVVGRAVDTLLFDGSQAFADSFITSPEKYPSYKKLSKKEQEAGIEPEIEEYKPWNLNATYCKEWAAEREAEGKAILTVDNMRLVKAMALEVASNPFAKKILKAKGAEFQVTLRWQNDDGIWLQARPDIVNFEDDTWDDLKSTRSLKAIGKNFVFLGYDIQAGMILDAMRRILGHDPKESRHIYVSKDLYPECKVVEWFGAKAGPIQCEYGMERAYIAAREIESAKATGNFSSTQTEIEVGQVPTWLQSKMVAGEELSQEEFLDEDAAGEDVAESLKF